MKLALAHDFANRLQKRFSLPGAAASEDQLKEPVAALIKAFGDEIDLAVSHKTETPLPELKVRPDMALYVGGLICGYIELKAPGNGADAPKLKGAHNKDQWKKLKSLPNLIYTDGQEWALYRNGKRKGGIIRFHDAPDERGAAAIDADDAGRLDALLRDFLSWSPIVPHSPKQFAEYLAPLTLFLRGEVEAALRIEGSNIGLLAKEWRNYFFPEADDAQFADAYAQTVTYAMLLARLSGAEKLDPVQAAKILDKGNGLLARTLELLGQDGARAELRTGFELLQRSMEALDAHEFLKAKPDLWLYFYEDFLAAYDSKLRNDYGVYYTPREVVDLQVRLASALLEKEFGKKFGFADEGVVFLDPAVGTGTYLVATVAQALDKVAAHSGPGAVGPHAAQMAKNMYGFEVLVGPYAVAHLRLTQRLESQGAHLDERLRIYLANTLESPYTTPPGGLSLTHKALTEEHEAARKVKQGDDILVCLGNPPYNRENVAQDDDRVRDKDKTWRKGGWVRHGDRRKGAADQKKQGEDPILTDFTAPASKAGAGVHLKNLYNDYVYFWRWALWRLFEQQESGGIVTFITASSYLAGPGFIGMREVMRRTFDALWIIDLGGDNLGTRKTPNVFNIQIPVAIAIGMRGKRPAPDTPARVRYAKITGDTRAAKLAQLGAANGFAAFDWQECPSEWHAPMRPKDKGNYFQWIGLNDIFPLYFSGVKFSRTWPIAETQALLRRRWRAMATAPVPERKTLFKESVDRTIAHKVTGAGLPGEGEQSLAAITGTSPLPKMITYAYRAYDRQYALYDSRLGDRIGPSLWRLYGAKQLFLCTKFAFPLSDGQAIVATPHIPDLDHFHGSFGGKDIIPLYRDAAATRPNVTAGLLDKLSATYGRPVEAADLAAYVYALLGGQAYTQRFWDELATPGPRVPLTKEADTFTAAATLGRKLIWLHTYAARFQDNDAGRGKTIPPGTAKCLTAIADSPDMYPEKFSYDKLKQEIRIGDGRFGPVDPAIWDFEVSGLKVVKSWLNYRMKKRAGKKSSPLDDMRPECWTPAMTDAFLELLWVLQATLAMEPALAANLDRVVTGACFLATELPRPTDEEKKPPSARSAEAKGADRDLFAGTESGNGSADDE